MIDYNLSHIVTFNNIGTQYLNAQNIIHDYVTQINDKIILCILIIFTSYMLSSLILPRAKIGLDSFSDSFNNPNIKIILGFNIKIIDFLISLCETFALGSSIFIFGIAYYQGLLSNGSILWAICLVSLLLLILIVEIIGFFVNKKHKKVINYLKK